MVPSTFDLVNVKLAKNLYSIKVSLLTKHTANSSTDPQFSKGPRLNRLSLKFSDFTKSEVDCTHSLLPSVLMRKSHARKVGAQKKLRKKVMR